MATTTPTVHGYLPLWSSGAPSALGQDDTDSPAITAHLPAPGTATGCGVVVAPGGGYRILASDHEGLLVAQALADLGIAAFVLRYRVAPRYSSAVSLLDGQRALRLVRSLAARYGVDPARLGMLGFSAGGHLTLNVATAPTSAARRAAQSDGSDDARIDSESARPAFIAPVYAVSNGVIRGKKIDEYTPTDTLVTADSPPAFIVHTHEDELVSAEQSLLYYRACLAAGVAAELHVFGHGEHGVGLASGDPDVVHWLPLLQRWLRRRGMLTARPRVAVSGSLRIAGEPPGMAWLTFLPDDENAPIARTRVYASEAGRFAIPASAGPCEGAHRVEVRLVSNQASFDASGRFSLGRESLLSCHVEVSAGRSLAFDLR